MPTRLVYGSLMPRCKAKFHRVQCTHVNTHAYACACGLTSGCGVGLAMRGTLVEYLVERNGVKLMFV